MTNGDIFFLKPEKVFDGVKIRPDLLVKVNKNGFKKLGPSVVRLADSEGLQAHSLSVSERLKDL